MPIQIPCSCGKNLQVKDELAGKRIRCSGCGGVLEVPIPASADMNLVPAVAVDTPSEPPTEAEPEVADRPRKTKKKKKIKLTAQEKADLAKEKAEREYEEWKQRKYWRNRIIRGVAFIVAGLIIIGGTTFILLNYGEAFHPLNIVLFFFFGLTGVVKGAIGLIGGVFLGEEGD